MAVIKAARASSHRVWGSDLGGDLGNHKPSTAGGFGGDGLIRLLRLLAEEEGVLERPTGRDVGGSLHSRRQLPGSRDLGGRGSDQRGVGLSGRSRRVVRQGWAVFGGIMAWNGHQT